MPVVGCSVACAQQWLVELPSGLVIFDRVLFAQHAELLVFVGLALMGCIWLILLTVAVARWSVRRVA